MGFAYLEFSSLLSKALRPSLFCSTPLAEGGRFLRYWGSTVTKLGVYGGCPHDLRGGHAANRNSYSSAATTMRRSIGNEAAPVRRMIEAR